MNLTQKSYEQIRESLLTDDSLTEQRLSINQLSQQLGIGRSPVRDAINRLAAEGLLQPVAKSGVVVRKVSYEELRDIVGLREALEPYAAECACLRMDYTQLEELRSLCFEFARLARRVRDGNFNDREVRRQMQRADWRFHGIILAAAENPTLHKIVEDHHLLLRKVRYPSLQSVQHLALTIREHWRLYQALSRRDARGAARWMHRHAHRGGKAMLKSWEEVYLERT